MSIVDCHKRWRLCLLARRRRRARWVGYRHPEDFGYHFEDLVSPYTRTAGNINAKCMLILQDWASASALIKMGFSEEVAKFGHNPKLRTNIRLKALLRDHCELDLAETYGTNLFPFIKEGKMSAPVPYPDLCRAAKMFTSPEIDIIGPRFILALGQKTAAALRSATENRNIYELPHPAARISRNAMNDAWAKFVRMARDKGVSNFK